MMQKIKTLCLVDDDEVYQYLAQEVIQSTDLVGNVKSFSNGAEAIDFIDLMKNTPEELPEIILLDLFMPVLDGWGFLEKFHVLQPNLQKRIIIFIVSSSIDPLDVERAKSISEVSGYVIKPLTREKFINSIQNPDFNYI